MRQFLACVLAAMCVQFAHAQPIKPTMDHQVMQITVIWASQREVAEYCASLGAWGGDVRMARGIAGRRPIGCARIFPDSGRCEVIAPKPERVDDERTLVLGHEVLHCFLGAYHDDGR